MPTKKSDKLDAFIALIDEEAARLRTKYLAEIEGKPSSSPDGDVEDDVPMFDEEDIPE